jgi:hypothetical protein
MEYIKIFIIIQFLLLLFQFINFFSLDNYQYYELIFGSFFIILIFGLFGYVLTLQFLEPDSNYLNNIALFSSLYAIWFYITRKLTNYVNTSSNGVINYN